MLTAMGTDFLPRLTAASHDNATMNPLVNEQTEMGIVIAIPGVVAMRSTDPIGDEGVLLERIRRRGGNGALADSGRVLARCKLASELFADRPRKERSICCYRTCIRRGQRGVNFTLHEPVAIGGRWSVICALLCIHTIMLAVITSWVTGFCWTGTALKLLIPALLILVTIFGCTRLLPERWSIAIGLVATAVVGTASFLKLQHMLRVDLWQAIHRTLHQSNNAAITKTESKNALLSTKAEFPEKDII